MSEQFNQELSLFGKIPSGLFNTMFGFSECWQKDATTTKKLAFDGWFITLYNVELVRSQIILSEHVKKEVPASWDPAILAEFIGKYGTHIVVGVKMGGKDVIHIKQLQNSSLQPTEVQILLKELADKRFSEDRSLTSNSDKLSEKEKDLFNIQIRRGGIDNGQSHSQWLSSVSQSPNVISMSFVPIASLLSGVNGSGFLSHAINLYLRYKPPIDEIHQFLEFQLPRQWAPVYGDLPLGPRYKRQVSPSLQLTFLGPKLYVNTSKVDSGNRPVTGIRLHLEGRRSDHLAVHLLHLVDLSGSLQLSDDPTYEPIEQGYFEPVKWSIFSHVCTAPVEYNGARIDDSASIVVKAWFEVKTVGMRKVLFLRLGFSVVANARIRRSEWAGMPQVKMPAEVYFKNKKKTTETVLNSAVYPGGPPLPRRAPKLMHFVDTNEITWRPEEPPGYWVVTGAKLCIEGGRITIKAKFSLLTMGQSFARKHIPE